MAYNKRFSTRSNWQMADTLGTQCVRMCDSSKIKAAEFPIPSNYELLWYKTADSKSIMHCQKAMESRLIHGELTIFHESF